MRVDAKKSVFKIMILFVIFSLSSHLNKHRFSFYDFISPFAPLGPGKRGHIVADTLFPCLPPRATFVADTNFVSGTQKMFLILFRNILCPQQMFPSLRAQEKS